eukprot:gene9765-2092_t
MQVKKEENSLYKNTLNIPPQSNVVDGEEESRLLEDIMFRTGKGYLAAAGGGATWGLIKGITSGGGSIKLSINSVLNEIGKRSIKWGNGTAVALLMYQGMEFGINYVRDVEYDPLTPIASGFLTGAIYRSRFGNWWNTVIWN